MQFFGYIKDSNGQPIPFASVFLADDEFKSIGIGASAGASGFFSFYGEPDPYNTFYVAASSVGYYDKVVMIENFKNGSTIQLKRNVLTLPPVVVTSGQKNKFPVWLLLLAAFLIIKR